MSDTKQYGSLREKIAAEKAERQGRYAAFTALLSEAHQAGADAAAEAVPTPMIVGTARGLFDDSFDPSKPTYYESEGVCGFAWVRVGPGTCSFARWLVKEGHAHKAFYNGGGVYIWIHAGGQSMQRKEAYAQAMVDVLKASPLLEKVSIYACSRMD